jgi:hypothetical protein
MLKRWKKPWINEHQFNDLLENVSAVLENYKIIVITYQSTGANWLGVQTATKGMFSNNVLILPQSYSSTLLSEAQRDTLIKHMISNGVQSVIFSGLPNYILKWLMQFHSKNIKTGIIYHGGLAELNGNEKKQKNFKIIIDYSQKGIINKIGVVKEGLDFWFKSNTKAKIHKVYPTFSIPPKLVISKYSDDKIHIGIFGNSTYNKNRHTQVAAAAQIDNSVVHILAPNEFDYLLPPNRIVVHHNINRTEFLSILGSMHINIYCSFSESWGQVILESIALKTPCLFSNNSGIKKFVGNDFLVSEYDNPNSICTKINEVLNLNKFPLSDSDLLEIEKKINYYNMIFLNS